MKMKDIKSQRSFGFSWIIAKYHEEANISTFSALMLLLKSTVSIDPFIIIIAYQCGLALCSLIGILLMGLTIISLTLYVKCWGVSNSITYTGVWKHCFGNVFSWIPSFCIMISYFSLSSLCTLEFYYDVTDIFAMIPILKRLNPPNKKLIDFSLMFLSVIPSIISNKFSALFVISIIGNIGLFLACLSVVNKFYWKWNQFGINPDNKLKWWDFDISAVTTCYSYFNVAFFIHPIIYLIVKEMKSPTERTTMRIAISNSLLVGLIDMGIGIISYLLYYDDFEPDIKIITKFPKDSIWTLIGTIGSFLSNMGSNCAFVLFVVKELCDLLLENSSNNLQSRMISAASITFMGFAFSLAGEMTNDYVWSLSSLTFYILVYVLPPAFYLKAFGFQNELWCYLSILTIVASTPLASMEIYGSFFSG